MAVRSERHKSSWGGVFIIAEVGVRGISKVQNP